MWYFSLLMLICCGIASGRQPFKWGRLLDGFSNSSMQSIGDYARQKMADLHLLRSKLEKQNSLLKIEENKRKNLSGVMSNTVQGDFNFSSFLASEKPILSLPNEIVNVSMETNNSSAFTSLAEIRNSHPSGPWEGLQSMFSSKQARHGLLTKLLPRTEMLKKLIKISRKLDPSLRGYLTGKYNSFLHNLIPYSNNIGIPPFVLNAMTISQNYDSRWNFIESLLDNSNVNQFLNSLPEFTMSPSSSDLSSQMRARSDDQDTFVKSDQEPDATSKGQKKYPNLDISSSNRRTRLRKGEVLTPERTGYEQAFDQYGLYGHDSYDATTYGKGYDDYYSMKSYGTGNGGGGMSGSKGYGSGMGYDDGYRGGSKSYGMKGKGWASYGTAKGHGGGGGGGGGYGGGGGGGGGGYGGSGGSGYGSNGIMDPFSILGGLAFLTYLGLLLQQSLNRNNTGRAFPNYRTHFDGDDNNGVYSLRQPNIKLTRLSFHDIDKHEGGGDVERARKTRSVRKVSLQDTINELEYIWKQIRELEQMGSVYCRHLKLCQLVGYIGKKPHLLSLFVEALEARAEDKSFVEEMLQRRLNGEKFKCEYDLRCAG